LKKGDRGGFCGIQQVFLSIDEDKESKKSNEKLFPLVHSISASFLRPHPRPNRVEGK
jgi:hypothetical protein